MHACLSITVYQLKPLKQTEWFLEDPPLDNLEDPPLDNDDWPTGASCGDGAYYVDIRVRDHRWSW